MRSPGISHDPNCLQRLKIPIKLRILRRKGISKTLTVASEPKGAPKKEALAEASSIREAVFEQASLCQLRASALVSCPPRSTLSDRIPCIEWEVAHNGTDC